MIGLLLQDKERLLLCVGACLNDKTLVLLFAIQHEKKCPTCGAEVGKPFIPKFELGPANA
jgi:hypothetical protein